MRNVPWEEVGFSPALPAPEWGQRTEQRKWAIERHDYLCEKARETCNIETRYTLPPSHPATLSPPGFLR